MSSVPSYPNAFAATTAQGYIPNPYNQLLAQKHGQSLRAQRAPLGTQCDPRSGKPIKRPTKQQLQFAQINANMAGDNVLLPALAGVRQIFELVIWNVAAQNVRFQQGSTAGGQAIALLPLIGMPALIGFILGFNGSFEMPHWEIDPNQPLVVNLSVGTQVTGYIRYRTSSSGN
jgi:hypothetical protein